MTLRTTQSQFTGLISWQEKRVGNGATPDSGTYQVSQASVTWEGDAISLIEARFSYQRGRNDLTLRPLPNNPHVFHGSLVVRGSGQPQDLPSLRIECMLYSTPDDEWIFFGDWHEDEKDYYWWLRFEQ